MAMKTVCVFCASSPRIQSGHLEAARQLGQALATGGFTTLYGGGAVGLMGAVADGARQANGHVVGVRPRFISDLESAHPGVEEMIFTENMHQRKQLMFDRSDAFVALPGAIGTLDELVEVITWRRLGLHNRPICVLNMDGFFDPLRAMFARMVEEDLVAREFLDLVGYVADAKEIINYLREFKPSVAAPILWKDEQRA